MKKSKYMEMREESDDLIFKMRMLAGSGDLDMASVHLINMSGLIGQAVKAHMENGSFDSEFNLSYILSNNEMMAHHVAGVHVDNRSRTAKEAREYRQRMEDSEND